MSEELERHSFRMEKGLLAEKMKKFGYISKSNFIRAAIDWFSGNINHKIEKMALLIEGQVEAINRIGNKLEEAGLRAVSPGLPPPPPPVPIQVSSLKPPSASPNHSPLPISSETYGNNEKAPSSEHALAALNNEFKRMLKKAKGNISDLLDLLNLENAKTTGVGEKRKARLPST